MFVLPSNFNVITDLKNIKVGVNILVPHIGQPKKLRQYLEDTALKGTTTSNIVGLLVELTTNNCHYNDYTPAQAHALPKRPDFSYCMYRRVQTLVFKSGVLKQDFIYRDYTFILNVMRSIELRSYKDNITLLEQLRNWMRYYELTFKVRKADVIFYRNEAEFIRVDRNVTRDLYMESQNKDAYFNGVPGTRPYATIAELKGLQPRLAL